MPSDRQRFALSLFLTAVMSQLAVAQSSIRDRISGAIWEEDVRTVQRLVGQLENIDYGDKATDPVLWQAVSTGNLRLVKVLVEAGASVNVRESNWGMPAFNQAASSGDLSVIDCLIKRGAKIDATDKFGGNALEEAAFMGDRVMAKKLQSLGLKTKFPLHVAAGLGDVKTVKKLLERKTDVNQVTGWKNSALFFAASGESLESTKLLLEAGTKTETKNIFGCTALFYAVPLADPAITQALIEAGADVNAINKDGERPLDWAHEESVINLLKSAGAKPGEPR